MLALSAMASATLLFSCSSRTESTTYDFETLLTESSHERTITMMENGKRSYTFSSPLMEGYSLATNPYQEFRRGIKMTTYTDSLSLVDATITANYAIYYERQKLWEAKGNVVIIKNNRSEGDTTVTGHTEIYTQQLFWNATTKKIYSNVDTKVLQPDGWHFGVGFDADEDLKNIHFRKYSSEMEFDMSQPTEEEKREREAKREADKADKKGADKKGTEKPGGINKFDTQKDKNRASNSRNNTVKGHKSQQNKGIADKGSISPSTMPKRDNNVTPPRPGGAISPPSRPNGNATISSSEVPSSGIGEKREVIHNQQEIKFSTDFNTDAVIKRD
ncbi:MAG: LPS export ABC transporter periplasmic protein LptC [Alistipes sp.]|nr:LPS export ABC transporter periplasmic protein LptC [Alistipes sp.]